MPELNLKEALAINILHRLLEAIHSTDDIIDIFVEATRQLSQAVKCDHVNILLNNEKARYFCIIQALNQSTGEPGEDIIIPYSETSLTEIIHLRHSVIRPDLSGRGALTPGDLKFLAEGVRSDLSAPIICKSKIFGIINLSSYESNFFNEHHQDQTEQIASLLGLALERSELIEKLNRKQSDLLFWKTKFNSLNHAINEAVAIIRLDYDLIYESNRAFQRLTGYNSEELHGERLSRLHPQQEELILSNLDKCSAEAKEAEIKRLKLIRKDGIPIPVKLKLLFIGGNIIKFAFALYEEITKPRSYQLKNTDSVNDFVQLQLAVVNEINRLANADLALEKLIRAALLAIKEAVDFDYAQIALFDTVKGLVENHTIISERCREFDSQKNWHILEDRDFYWYNIIEQNLQLQAEVNEKIERELHSRASGVLMTKHRHLGTLVLGSLEPNFYQQQQVKFIKQVAEQIALIIDNASLYNEHKTNKLHCAIQQELSSLIGSDLTIENVLSNTVKLSAEKMQSQLSTIQLIENHNHLTGITTNGPGCDKNAISRFEANHIFPQLKNSREQYVIKSISPEDLDQQEQFEAKLHEYYTCITIYLKSDIGTIGMLSNYWKKTAQLDSENLNLLQAISVQASRAIENARAFQGAISHSDRLKTAKSELEKFVEMVSCNLKNPLGSIQGLSLTLLDKLKDELNDEALGYLERIGYKAVKLQRYIDDLHKLACAGQIVNSFEDANIAEIIEGAKQKLFNTINQKQITIEIDKNLPNAFCDQNLMQQLFVNLLENAIEELGEDTERPKIDIGYRKEINQDVFFIRNNGAGKRKAYHANIFDLFDHIEMEENDEKCKKIGLAIAKKIIEIHDGQIWYESAEGKGSTIFIGLPMRKLQIVAPTRLNDHFQSLV